MNFRVEFNNIFNRTVLPTPIGGAVTATASATTQGPVNFALAPSKFQTGTNAGLYNGGFGTISVLSGIGGQGTGTYVLHIQF